MNLSQLATLYLFKFFPTYCLSNNECIDLYFKLTKLDTTGQKCDEGTYWKCDMWFRAYLKEDKSKEVLFYNGDNQETLNIGDTKYRETENLALANRFSNERKEVIIVLQFADEGTGDIKSSEIREIFETFEENGDLDHVNKEIRVIWQNTLRINLQHSLETKQFNPAAIQPNETIADVKTDKSSIFVTYGYELEIKNNCSTTSPTTTPPPTTAPITTTMTETTTVTANMETIHSTTITSTSILTKASSGVISTVPPTTETTQTAVTLSRMPSTPTIVTDEADYSGTTSGTSQTEENYTESVSESEFPSVLKTNQQTTATISRPSISNDSVSTAPQTNETTGNAVTVSRNPSTRTAVIDQSGYFNGTTNGTVPSKQDSTGSNSEKAEFPTAMLIVLILFILLGVGLVLAIVWHDKLYDTVVPLLMSANPVN